MADVLAVRDEYRAQQWAMVVQECRSSGMTNRGPGVKFCVSVFRQKSRMALESRADSGLNSLFFESHGGQNGMRAGTA